MRNKHRQAFMLACLDLYTYLSLFFYLFVYYLYLDYILTFLPPPPQPSLSLSFPKHVQINPLFTKGKRKTYIHLNRFAKATISSYNNKNSILVSNTPTIYMIIMLLCQNIKTFSNTKESESKKEHEDKQVDKKFILACLDLYTFFFSSFSLFVLSMSRLHTNIHFIFPFFFFFFFIIFLNKSKSTLYL